MKNICFISWEKVGFVALTLLISTPVLQAQHREGGAPPNVGHPQAPAPRPEPARPFAPAQQQIQRPAEIQHRPEVQTHQFDRIQHGSIRHSDSPLIRQERQAPFVRQERVEPRIVDRGEGHDRFDVHRHFDVDVDRRHHFWGGFVPGVIVGSLPIGYQTIVVNGAPYNYYDGVYYQPGPSGYAEVYPPVGAAVVTPPDGAIPVVAGNQTYYYAGGAFYVQQGDQFVVAPPPIGVVVPELPPGAVQVVVNGQIAYQFNGIYYVPVFVNGVTEYQTFLP
jgi:hypothetical protein